MRFARPRLSGGRGLFAGLLACAVAAGLATRAVAEDSPAPHAPRADLDVRCVVTPARAEVGATVEAVITATNRGDLASGPVKVDVTVPDGLHLIEDMPMPVNAGTVGPGASTQVRMNLRALSAGSFTLLWAAETSAADRTEGGSPIDVTGGSLQTNIVCRPASVAVGARFEVEVDLVNGMASSVRNVVVALTWPAGIKPRTLGTAKLPEITAGHTDKFVFEGIAQRAGTFHHEVKISGDGIPEASLAADLTVTGAAAAPTPATPTSTTSGYDVSIEAPARMNVGEAGVVRVKVARRGAPGSAAGTPTPMRVALSLAPELDFVVAPAPGSTTAPTPPRRTTTGNFTLKPGESITFENRVKASKAPTSHQAAVDATVERVSDGAEQGRGTRAISVP